VATAGSPEPPRCDNPAERIAQLKERVNQLEQAIREYLDAWKPLNSSEVVARRQKLREVLSAAGEDAK
jgi:hypothetical protein